MQDARNPYGHRRASHFPGLASLRGRENKSCAERREGRTNVEETLVSSQEKKKTPNKKKRDITYVTQFSHSSRCSRQRNILCSEQSAVGLGHCEFLMAEAFFSGLVQTAAGFHPLDHTPTNDDCSSETEANHSGFFLDFFFLILQMCLLPENKERRTSVLHSSERFA